MSRFVDSIKEKTAIISICLQLVFTLLKFLAYGMTGSLAILAEAWHSFSDIFTSVCVFFSVKKRHFYQSIDEADSDNEPTSKIQKTMDILIEIHPEYKVALAIGVILLCVAIALLRKTVMFEVGEIRNTLSSGLVFLFFAYCSYLLYKFQSKVGKKENSAALISDGMHSKADMYSSLCAGVSLIFYKMGYNIDKYAAFAISLLIFQAAVEVLFNFFMNVYRANVESGECQFNYKTYDIITRLIHPKLWRAIIGWVEDVSGITILGSNLISKLRDILKVLIPVIMLSFYLSTGVFVVNTGEEALVERLGKPLSGEAIQPGLHLKYPWPIDKVIYFRSKEINQVSIGNISDKNSYALLWSSKHGTERAFLSGDNYFFYPYFIAQYRISNLWDFYYSQKDAYQLLNHISYQVLTKFFSTHSFNGIILENREELEQFSREEIQRQLDELNVGIELLMINMKDAHPPIFISNSFEDVVAAYQDKQRTINRAMGHRNSELPLMRSQSYEMVSDAEAFVINMKNKAEGEAKRFNFQLEGFKLNPSISYKKLYLEEIGKSVKNNQLVIVDPKCGTPEVWLNFEQSLMKGKK